MLSLVHRLHRGEAAPCLAAHQTLCRSRAESADPIFSCRCLHESPTLENLGKVGIISNLSVNTSTWHTTCFHPIRLPKTATIARRDCGRLAPGNSAAAAEHVLHGRRNLAQQDDHRDGLRAVAATTLKDSTLAWVGLMSHKAWRRFAAYTPPSRDVNFQG